MINRSNGVVMYIVIAEDLSDEDFRHAQESYETYEEAAEARDEVDEIFRPYHIIEVWVPK